MAAGKKLYEKCADTTGTVAGHPWFAVAILLFTIWSSYKIFVTDDKETSSWWLDFNQFIGQTINFIVFLLLQNGMNRQSRATHLKLDELIRVHPDAENDLINVEEQDNEEELVRLKDREARVADDRP